MSALLQSAIRWWEGREPRERILLAILGALVVALVYVYGLLLPLQRLAQAEADRHRAVAAALGEVRSLQAAIKAQEAGAGRRVSEDLVRRTAAEASVPLTAVEPVAGGALAVSIEAVPAKPLFLWLTRLSQANGVGVRQFETHQANEGLVQARVVLGGAAP